MYQLTAESLQPRGPVPGPRFLMADEIVGHMREKILIPDSVVQTMRKPLAKGTLPFKADERSDHPGSPSSARATGST